MIRTAALIMFFGSPILQSLVHLGIPVNPKRINLESEGMVEILKISKLKIHKSKLLI